MKKPMVSEELIAWLRERYPNQAASTMVTDLNQTNFEAGQQYIIELLERLSESRRTEFD